MTATVRPATLEDADALAALAREFHEEHGDPVEFLTAEAIRRDGFGAEPEFAVVVAENAGELVGYALYYDAYEPAYAARGSYMADLYVRPSARRLGLGRSLIAAVAEDTRRRGRRYVWWVAQAANESAHAFYRILADVEIGLRGFAVTREAFDALAGDGES